MGTVHQPAWWEWLFAMEAARHPDLHWRVAFVRGPARRPARLDPSVPIEETVGAIADMIAAGKVRYFGVSNFRGWQHADVVRICEALNLDRPVVSQPYYNAMNRMPEIEPLPACGYYGLGVVPYSPIARGVLSGATSGVSR